jgi:hypothetical protein
MGSVESFIDHYATTTMRFHTKRLKLNSLFIERRFVRFNDKSVKFVLETILSYPPIPIDTLLIIHYSPIETEATFYRLVL